MRSVWAMGLVLAGCSDRAMDAEKDGSASGGDEGTSTTTRSTSTSGTTPADSSEAVEDGVRPFDLGPRFDFGARDVGVPDCEDAPERLTPVCGSSYGGEGLKLAIVCADPGELIECPAADSAWTRERITVCECFPGDPVDGPVCGPLVDHVGACCYWFENEACPPDVAVGEPVRR